MGRYAALQVVNGSSANTRLSSSVREAFMPTSQTRTMETGGVSNSTHHNKYQDNNQD